MMGKLILPLILALLGAGAGAGAGWFLKPAPDMTAEKADAVEGEVAEDVSGDASDKGPEDAASRAPKGEPMDDAAEGSAPDATEFVKLNNQFVVPVVSEGIVSSLVVMSLSLEVDIDMRAMVFQREPKLRDALLQVMFDHANVGGFDGSFTEANNLAILRAGLTDVARQVLPGTVYGVLIVDLARQDL
ncbi:MAG: flagellar basal body-associated FliL family protein [Pseudomonadota bacterium]